MTEPVYRYVKGSGWVPSTDQGIEVGWCAHPIDISKDKITYRVHHPEDFFVFLKRVGDGTPIDQLRAMNSNYCRDACFQCARSFADAWRKFSQAVVHLTTDNHPERLEAAISLWQSS